MPGRGRLLRCVFRLPFVEEVQLFVIMQFLSAVAFRILLGSLQPVLVGSVAQHMCPFQRALAGAVAAYDKAIQICTHTAAKVIARVFGHHTADDPQCPYKEQFFFSTIAEAFAGQAQQVNQSESAWYTDAQAEIERKLARQPITGRAKNVILFVADGNSVGTNYAIRLFDGQKKGGLGDDNILSYENFPYLALVKTYNVNAQTPDSAPTASAMNTGVKSNFTTINVSENAVAGDCATLAGNELTTFAEVVSAKDKSVGIVTTTRMTHATPAASASSGAAVSATTAAAPWARALSM